MLHTLFALTRGLVEGATILTLRLALGDGRVVELSHDYLTVKRLARLAKRHPRQAASLMEAAQSKH